MSIVECTCEHAAEDHDFDTGCTRFASNDEDDYLGCDCEWWNEEIPVEESYSFFQFHLDQMGPGEVNL